MESLFADFEPTNLIPVRDYQMRMVQAVLKAWNSKHSIIAQLYTGGGKTRCAARIMQHRFEYGDCLFLANRDQLVEQAYSTFRELMPDISAGIEQADRYTRVGPGAPQIVVASKDTLCKQNRLDRMGPDRFGTIFVDEAHWCGQDVETWQRILRYFEGAKRLGITATPERQDRKLIGEGMPFEDVCFQMDIGDGIAEGWVVPVAPKYAYVEGYDISQVDAGEELNQEQLERVMTAEKPLVGVCQAVVQFSEEGKRQSITFANSVKHAERIAEMLNRWHIKRRTGTATAISCYDGTADDRKEIFRLYRRGDIRHLVNVGIVAEGVDLPSAEVGILARPTKVHRLYVQWVGRFLRPTAEVMLQLNHAANAEERRAIIAASGKPKGIIVDLVGVTGRHKLVTVIDMFAPEDTEEPVRKRAIKMLEDGEVDDIQEALKEAQVEWDEQKTAARQGVLVAAHLATQEIDPYLLFDAKTMKKLSTKKVLPATDVQQVALRNIGVSKAMIAAMGYAEAAKIIAWANERRKNGLCNLKQMRVLRRFGYDPKNMDFQTASKLISELERKGWRR